MCDSDCDTANSATAVSVEAVAHVLETPSHSSICVSVEVVSQAGSVYRLTEADYVSYVKQEGQNR